MLKKLKQRGQVLVFYALMIPTLFMFIGTAADFGWYYLNVSRLQNAADSAVLAGAQVLVESGNAFDNYYLVSLATNDLPDDFDDYKDVYTNTFDKDTIAQGKLNNYRTADDEDLKNTLKAGRVLAEQYTRRNLSDDSEITNTDSTYVASATDGWNISSAETDGQVSANLALKYKIVDGKNDVYGPLYYVVYLQEKIQHFLLPGWFDPMTASVKAVAMLRPHYKGLIEPIQQFERTKIIDNWEYAKAFRGKSGTFSGNWNHYQAGVKGNSNYGVRYTNGNPYRNESVIVTPSRKTSGRNVITSADGSSGEATDANGGQWYLENQVDSINIDFRAEVKEKFSSDWDLGQAFPEGGHSYQFTNDNSWSADNGANLRILFNAEFDTAFEARDNVIHDDPSDNRNADPLWVRIESEPLKNPYTGAGVSNFNSVRQITLNFNADNHTSVKSDSGGKYYEYRPYFIFYDGPENIDYTVDSNGVLNRHSQPVVINLNAHLNAIMYMPESPVIINGNGYNWRGFVIAKCYLQAITGEDMTRTGFVWKWDGFNATEKFTCGFTELKDGYGNTIYVKNPTLLDELTAPNEEAEKIEDDGTVSFYEPVPVPKYILLEYTKADHDTYATKDDGTPAAEGETPNENKTFARYVTATYKEKFKTFNRLTDDSQITAITFPNESYNETTATYWVKTADLKDNKPTGDNYVKVLAGGATKYVDKRLLPYVKVRTNQEYFYVCVYDLKLTASGGKGVRMIDNSYTDEELNSSFKKTGNVSSTVADIYINPSNTYGDSWAIDRTWYSNNWKKWQKNQINLSDKNGVKYFTLKTEVDAMSNSKQLIVRYRKIDDGEGGTKYLNEEGYKFYTKVLNNAHNENNYIIVDDTGNVLTKPVTSPEVFTARTEEKNDTLKGKATTTSPFVSAKDAPLRDYWNKYTRDPNAYEQPNDPGTVDDDGIYVGTSDYRLSETYRIPALERVYKKSAAFNLGSNTYYSYFDIDDLLRINYTYMNVDELEHTVKRDGVTSEEIESHKLWNVEDMFFTKARAEWVD